MDPLFLLPRILNPLLRLVEEKMPEKGNNKEKQDEPRDEMN